MSDQISVAHINEFKAGVMTLAQQQGSKLRPAVRNERQEGESSFYDQVGATTMRRRTVRHGDSPFIPTPHDRRECVLEDFDWGDFIDSQDDVRTLNSFQNPYLRAAGYAAGRTMDAQLIEAVFGTARTGQKGATTIDWDTFATANPDHLVGTGAPSAMSLAKWTDAKTALDGADLVDDTMGYYLVTSEKEINSLLGDTSLTSADFNTVKALVRGEINQFLGMTVIMISSSATDNDGNTLLPVEDKGDGNVRRSFAMAGSRLLLGMGIDQEADVARRADKGFSWYAHLKLTSGATRMEEKGFVEIRNAP